MYIIGCIVIKLTVCVFDYKAAYMLDQTESFVCIQGKYSIFKYVTAMNLENS